jgi:hypothetical protein
MENNPYKNAIIIERGTTYGYGRHATLKEAPLEENKPKNTLSGWSVFFKEASVGFYTESGCLMGVIPITAPHTIMTVKQWKAIHELEAEYQKANAMTQKIENSKREFNNYLEKIFEANRLDEIDSDEYDKL